MKITFRTLAFNAAAFVASAGAALFIAHSIAEGAEEGVRGQVINDQTALSTSQSFIPLVTFGR